MSLRSVFRVVMSYHVSLRSVFRVVLSYYVSLRSVFRVVMSYHVSLRSVFRVSCPIMCLYVLYSVFVVLSCVFTFCIPCCDVRYNFHIKRWSLSPVFCERDQVLFMLFVLVCV